MFNDQRQAISILLSLKILIMSRETFTKSQFLVSTRKDSQTTWSMLTTLAGNYMGIIRHCANFPGRSAGDSAKSVRSLDGRRWLGHPCFILPPSI